MPTNFSAGLETQGAPVGPVEMPQMDNASTIEQAGKAFTDLASMFGKRSEEDKLGALSGELADIEAANINFNVEQARIIQEMAATSDQVVLQRLSGELTTLRSGQDQGRLPAPQARLRTLDTIKRYSQAYPMLAVKIRAMANESMDNFREVYNEVYGNDPTNKVLENVYSEALKNNTTPANILDMNNAIATADAEMKAAEVLAKTKSLDRDTALRKVQMDATTRVRVSLRASVLDFNSRLTRGEPLREADIDNMFARIESEYLNKYTQQLVAWDAYSEQGIKDAMAPAFLQIDAMRRIMKSSGATVEEKVAAMKQQAELDAGKDADELKKLRAGLPGYLKFAPDNILFETLMAADVILQSTGKFDYRTQQGNEAWQGAGRSGLIAGNPQISAGLLLLNTDVGQELLGQTIGTMAHTPGAALPTDTPEITTAAKRGINEMLGRITNPQEARTIAGNAIGHFSWIDLTRNPNVANVVRDDPALVGVAMNKAAGFAAKWINDDLKSQGIDLSSIVLDHSNLERPFTIPGERDSGRTRQEFVSGRFDRRGNLLNEGRKPSYSELSTLPVSERLNHMYWDILNTYGSAALDQWITELGFGEVSPNYRKSLPVSDSGKKKVTTKFDKDFFSAEQKHNLPNGILAEVAKVESDFNPNAMGPLLKDGTRAMGLMQIIPKHHPGVNAMNPQAAIDYAGGYLRRLYDQFGSWDKALAAYNWGEGNVSRIANDPNWRSKLPKETQKYLQSILDG